MRTIQRLFVHCSATKPGMDIGAAEMRRWHLGQGWRDIGYHKVIRRDGTVEDGRPEEQVGSHAKGHNADSLAVCMVGGIGEKGQPECNYTLAQWQALDAVLTGWLARHPGATIHSHNEVEPGKACPVFAARYLMGG